MYQPLGKTNVWRHPTFWRQIRQRRQRWTPEGPPGGARRLWKVMEDEPAIRKTPKSTGTSIMEKYGKVWWLYNYIWLLVSGNFANLASWTCREVQDLFLHDFGTASFHWNSGSVLPLTVTAHLGMSKSCKSHLSGTLWQSSQLATCDPK